MSYHPLSLRWSEVVSVRPDHTQGLSGEHLWTRELARFRALLTSVEIPSMLVTHHVTYRRPGTGPGGCQCLGDDWAPDTYILLVRVQDRERAADLAWKDEMIKLWLRGVQTASSTYVFNVEGMSLQQLGDDHG